MGNCASGVHVRVCVYPVPSSRREALQLFEDTHSVPSGLDDICLGQHILGECLEESWKKKRRMHFSLELVHCCRKVMLAKKWVGNILHQHYC